MYELLNNILSKDITQTILLFVMTMFGGNTIRPIPEILDYHFQNTFLFKYVVLIFVGFRTLHPLNNKKMILIITLPLVLLCIINILRKIKLTEDQKKKIRRN